MTEQKAYWRQFGESVIDYIREVSRDQFFRTQTVIIGSLILLCVANIFIFAVSSHVVSTSSADLAAKSTTERVAGAPLVMNPDAPDEMLERELNYLRENIVVITATVSIIVTLISAYIIGRIALGPTRNALIMQKQFIANIAHEIRTPLSIIKANNEILRIESPHDPNIIKTTESTTEELDRISGIINNLLTLHAFDGRSLKFSSTDLSAALAAAADKMERLIQSRNQTLHRQIDADLYGYGEQNAIEQIAINLIKNASFYTPTGGNITVAAHEVFHKYIEFRVTDDGVGIAADKLSRIFEPFYQINQSRSGEGNSGSRGLGLAIVSELVKLHKGKIAVKSTPGQGTTIRVSIPMATAKQRNTHTPGEEREHEYVLNFSN